MIPFPNRSGAQLKITERHGKGGQVRLPGGDLKREDEFTCLLLDRAEPTLGPALARVRGPGRATWTVAAR